MTPARRPLNPTVSPPATAGRRVHTISPGKLKPLTDEDHRRMQEAARDPELTAGRKFPTINE